jgi:DNA-binding transcriptional MerR regulator
VSSASGRSEYSIAAVSKLTGVSCHALRVWERRYGYPVPHRSASGHRRYSPEQVRVLRRLSELVREGRTIGELIDDLRSGRLAAGGPNGPGASAAEPSPASWVVDRLVAADLVGAEAEYAAAAGGLSTVELIERLIEPALIDTGERWFRRECQVFQERCASGYLLRKLGELIDGAQRQNAQPRHKALVGTVQGDRHEGGSLILALLLELSGWRAVPMGVDLPVREYQRAVEAWRPDALARSVVLSRNINKRFDELSRLAGVPIFVGGRSILNYQGLARRHGLIPLPGPATQAIGPLMVQFEEWSRREGGGGEVT